MSNGGVEGGEKEQYSVPTRQFLLISALLMVLHTEISDSDFCVHRFRLAFWSIKSFQFERTVHSRGVRFTNVSDENGDLGGQDGKIAAFQRCSVLFMNLDALAASMKNLGSR